LHVFEVLDEQALERVASAAFARRGEAGRKLRFLLGAFIEKVDDEVPLWEIETRNADGRRLCVA